MLTSIMNYDQMAHEQALHDVGYEEGMGDGVLLGTLKAVKGMMRNMGVSLEKAMDTLEITGEERDVIAKEINK